jgi:hypothetical protein
MTSFQKRTKQLLNSKFEYQGSLLLSCDDYCIKTSNTHVYEVTPFHLVVLDVPVVSKGVFVIFVVLLGQ